MTHPLGVPPLAIAADDPLLAAAEKKARATLPAFLALLPEHAGRALVKFAWTPETGGTEHLWARVERREGDRLHVQVETPPVAPGPFDLARRVDLAEVEDWQVELLDGTIRGGFTVHAMFDIHRRDVGKVPRHLAAHEARFVDCRKPA